MNDFFCRLCKEIEKAEELAGDGGPRRDGQIGPDPGQTYQAGVRDGLNKASELWVQFVVEDDAKQRS